MWHIVDTVHTEQEIEKVLIGAVKMDFMFLFVPEKEKNPSSGAFVELVKRDRPAAFER